MQRRGSLARVRDSAPYVLLFVSWLLPAIVADNGGPHQQCSGCHRPGASLANGDRAVPDSGVCIDCHSDVLLEGEAVAAASFGARAGHLTDSGPGWITPPGGSTQFEQLDCLTCHTGHPNDRPAQLRVLETVSVRAWIDETSSACLSCHSDFAVMELGGHYVRHPVGVTAPQRTSDADALTPLVDVRGTESIDDDVVACTSCHFVHTGPNDYLLRWNEEDQVEACGGCHEQGRRGGDAASIAGDL